MTTSLSMRIPDQPLRPILAAPKLWSSILISDDPADDRLLVIQADQAILNAQRFVEPEPPNAALADALVHAGLVFVAGDWDDPMALAWWAETAKLLRLGTVPVLLQTDWHSACRLVEVLGEATKGAPPDCGAYIDMVDMFSFAMDRALEPKRLRVGQSRIGAGGLIEASDAARRQLAPEIAPERPNAPACFHVFAIFHVHEEPSREQYNQLRTRLREGLESDGLLYMNWTVDLSPARPEAFFLLML